MTAGLDQLGPLLALWRAVVARMLEDAMGLVPCGEGYGPAVRARMADQARAWLRSRDCDLVCALAGLDADAVRAVAASGRYAAGRDGRRRGRVPGALKEARP